MKKYLFPILLLAIIATGCKPDEPEYKSRNEVDDTRHDACYVDHIVMNKVPIEGAFYQVWVTDIYNKLLFSTEYKQMYSGKSYKVINGYFEEWYVETKKVMKIYMKRTANDNERNILSEQFIFTKDEKHVPWLGWYSNAAGIDIELYFGYEK